MVSCSYSHSDHELGTALLGALERSTQVTLAPSLLSTRGVTRDPTAVTGVAVQIYGAEGREGGREKVSGTCDLGQSRVSSGQLGSSTEGVGRVRRREQPRRRARDGRAAPLVPPDRVAAQS